MAAIQAPIPGLPEPAMTWFHPPNRPSHFHLGWTQGTFVSTGASTFRKAGEAEVGAPNSPLDPGTQMGKPDLAPTPGVQSGSLAR